MKRHFAHSSNETSSKKSRKESESSSQGWQSFQKKSNAGSNSQRQRPSKPLDTTKPSEATPKFNLEQSKKSGLSVEMHPALQALMSGGSGDIKHVPLSIPKPDFATVKANVRAATETLKKNPSLASSLPSTILAAKSEPSRDTAKLKDATIPKEFYNPIKNPYFDPNIKQNQ